MKNFSLQQKCDFRRAHGVFLQNKNLIATSETLNYIAFCSSKSKPPKGSGASKAHGAGEHLAVCEKISPGEKKSAR